MSETAQTLIKGALRAIGVVATGETPSAAEMQDGLEALQLMLRGWSAHNIRLYYTKQESLALSGAESYTIGSGGSLDTVRPSSIRGAWTSDGPVQIVDEGWYRKVRASSLSGGPVGYLWYSPEYPLGKLYPWPMATATLYVDSLKPLTDPATITTDVSFPPEYDEAIKWNLAVRLAPEYGKEIGATIASLALSSLMGLQSRNFAEQVVSVSPELIRLASARGSIDYV
jgi:hypothetical protein